MQDMAHTHTKYHTGHYLKIFLFFGENLDTKYNSVLLTGNFTAPTSNWESGLTLSNCHFYSKLKSYASYTSICLLGLTLLVATDNSLELVYSNFNRVSTLFADVCVVKSDSCHPSLAIGISLDLHKLVICFEQSYRQMH